MVMKRPMVAFLTQLLFAFRSPLTRRARLEAENLLLRCTRHSWTRSSSSSRRPCFAGTDVVSAPTGAGNLATSAAVQGSIARCEH